MIISASRRTDIPAFYAEWFMKRIEAGYCTVPNPFNRNQVARVSLDPDCVDVITFWTRQPRPLFPYLNHLDELGYRYYFLFTLLDYPHHLEPRRSALKASIKSFQELATRIGADRVIWRYDPIIFTPTISTRFHQESFSQIAKILNGYTKRSIISFVDIYRKNNNEMKKSRAGGQPIITYNGKPSGRVDELMQAMVATASSNGMTIHSCAEKIDLAAYGIFPGKCIDSHYVEEQFGMNLANNKDPGQRKLCGCVVSKDVGMYNSCLFGCRYCYATSSNDLARHNYHNHQPASPSLLGWHE